MGIYGDYVLVFGIAAVLTYLLVFPIKRLGVRIGAVAHPGEYHVHAKATPTIGGAAMILAFLITMAIASTFGGFSQIFGSSEPLGVVLGAVVIFFVGLVDDVKNISTPAKVAGQVLAAMVLVVLGVTMYYFKIPFVPGLIVLLPSILPLVTALWVVGMANAVNLIDGLDGLAAGIVAIAAGTLGIYGLRLVELGNLTPDNIGPLVAVLACGVCIGFLPHNFHPARVFMGDGGALFLGLLMAAATMVIGGRVGTVASAGAADVSGLTFFRFAPLFLPFFILGVPIVDTAFAIVRRTIRRQAVSDRDLGHLHHRLIRLGHGHRRAVLILWAWTGVLSIFVLLPVFAPRANVYVPFVAVFLAVGLFIVFRPGSWAEFSNLPTPVAEVRPEILGDQVAAPERTTGPISVVVSGAAGVAVAGEPDLSMPRRRPSCKRVVRLMRRRWITPSRDPAQRELSGDQVAHSGDEMRG